MRYVNANSSSQCWYLHSLAVAHSFHLLVFGLLLLFSLFLALSARALTSGVILAHRNRYCRRFVRRITCRSQNSLETTKSSFTAMSSAWRTSVCRYSTVNFDAYADVRFARHAGREHCVTSQKMLLITWNCRLLPKMANNGTCHWIGHGLHLS